MKNPQKVVLLFAALILALVLHAPWTGYETDYPTPPVDTAALLRQCQAAGEPLDPGMGAAVISKRFADELACVERLRPPPRALPLSAWRSVSPVSPWFGSLLHAGGVALAILLLGLVGHAPLRLRSPSADTTAR